MAKLNKSRIIMYGNLVANGYRDIEEIPAAYREAVLAYIENPKSINDYI